MYLPPHFAPAQVADLHALVRAQPLATWVLPHEGQLLINHVPFMLDAERGEHGTLVGHVARANPVWKALVAQAAAAAAGGAQPSPSALVFQGPQAYISPNWYPSKHAHGKAVPTWNYQVVHAHGLARAIDDRAQVLAIVTRLTETHEATQALPWKVSDAPADYLDSMLGAIVGIEITVTRWVGKFKASQNRPATDRQGVAAGLQARGLTPEAIAAVVRPPETKT